MKEGGKDGRKKGTYKVCALVGLKAPFDPMEAAAMTWTAQPQSIDATEEIEPIVFASWVGLISKG